MDTGRGSPTLSLNMGSELNYEWEEESIPEQDSNQNDNIRYEENRSEITSDEPVKNYNTPEQNVFKIPRNITERKSQDSRRIKADQSKFDYNRLGRGNWIGGRGNKLQHRLGGRGSKWNAYNRRWPSSSPRGRFGSNYISRETQDTFSTVENYHQNQPGHSSNYPTWNKSKFNSKQDKIARNWDAIGYNSKVEYMDNNKNKKKNSTEPGYYTDKEEQLEYKNPEPRTQEQDNNLVNPNARQVIERDYDEESVGTLMIDEDEDNNESMIGNTSIFDKVKIWKENANMKTSTKKEISHLELTRHRIEFEDPAHDANRSGLKSELRQKLNREDFKQGKRMQCERIMEELVNIEDGHLYQGPEMKNLMKIMSVIKKSKLTMEPKLNYMEERIMLNGKNYQFKCFNGYLGDQLKSAAIHKMVDKSIMNAMLEAEGYDNSKEDLGGRYRQCATLKVWRTILRGREENKPKIAGDLLNNFDESQWEEEDLNINSTELGSESQRIVQQKYFPLGMDLEHVKKNFPITYELNMIVCLQHLLVEYTKNQGSWRETPSSGLISIFQEDKPFECKEFSIDLDLENMKHTFRVPKQNNVLIDTFPDLKILLSAGYINNKGRLRKYEKTAKKIIIGQRVIKKSRNIAVRPGWKRRKTYVDIIKHMEKGTRSELDFTVEDVESEERSEQTCRCQTSDIAALQAQICYTEEFYDSSKLTHRRENVVEDLSPWVNNEILLKNGVNPAMNSYSINSNRLLVPSEPGAIVSSTPHEKTGLFCGTTNTPFRDKMMEQIGDRELTKIIEKEINQLPERLSNKAMIGEQMEEEIRKSYNTIACYVAGNPVVAPSMFTSFKKFGAVEESTETWKVKDMEQLISVIHDDVKSWKQICCPLCFVVMQKKEFKIHYLDNHKDSIILVNTCDMIRSNHRSYISFILFIIICLEDKIQISYDQEINKLKQRIENQNREKEIYSQAPGYEELKRTHDLFVREHFEKEKSWTEEVANLKEQLKTMSKQTRKTKDEDRKNTKLTHEIRDKEREIMEIKEKLKIVQEQIDERMNVQEQNNERIEEVKNDKSRYEDKLKEMERRYREEKIKNAGLTRKIKAMETEKNELKEEIENATEFFEVLVDNEIATGEELLIAIDETNDELIEENVGLKEVNRNLETENKRLISDLKDSEGEWGKIANAELEEMEDNSGEFFMAMDELMDEKDKRSKDAIIKKEKLRMKYKTLESYCNSLERKIRFKKLQLDIKNKMMTRRLKKIINKEIKERKNSTYGEEESQLYDELYEGRCTYENTIAVQPERNQENIPIFNMATSKIEENIHQRQDMLLDEFLKNEFKIHPEPESESE